MRLIGWRGVDIMKKKSWVLSLIGCLCLGSSAYVEGAITEPLSGQNIELSEGQQVSVDGGEYAIEVRAGGEGLKITGGAEIRLENASSLGRAVFVLGGADADFGKGTSVYLSGGDAGIKTEGKGNIIADGLKVTVENKGDTGTANYGIFSTSATLVDLGSGSEVNVTTGVGTRAEGINLNQVEEFRATDLTINAKATGKRGVDGVTLQNSKADFGNGSSVITRAESSDAENNGFFLGGGHLTADRLNVKASGGKMAVAIYMERTANHNEVNLKNSELIVDQATNSYGLIISRGHADFIQGNIDVTGENYAYGVYLVNEISSFYGEDITIRTTSTTGNGNSVGLYVTEYDGSASAVLRGNISILSDQYAMAAVSEGANIDGAGKMTLEGNLFAMNGGNISLAMQEDSSFVGAAGIGNSGTIQLDLAKTTWVMTGDSDITTLNFGDSASKVIFSGVGNFNTLTSDTLSGDGGHFFLRTDIVGDGEGNNSGDFMYFAESDGAHFVTVKNDGAANATGNETLTIITTGDGGANFRNAKAVEVGGYEFALRDVAGSEKKEWELYSTGRASGASSAGVNLFSGGYLLNYGETQTLFQRMGDLRAGEKQGNIWARSFGGKIHSAGDGFMSGYQMNYGGMQVGSDKKFALKNGKGNVYVGGMAGYSKAGLSYGSGNGSIDSKTVGVYGTFMAPNGFYSDVVLKYGWLKNDFKVLDSLGDGVMGNDIHTHEASASLEMGRRYYFEAVEKEGWYAEPQAQITMGHQSGGRFTASNGLNISVDSYTSILGRLGTNIGYEVKNGKNPINAYAKVSYVHEFDGAVGYSLNHSEESTDFGGSWWTYGLGVTAQVGKKHNVYFDVERATGGEFTQSWKINGGYRFHW
jgi:outer membrane autotransporter barrel domain